MSVRARRTIEILAIKYDTVQRFTVLAVENKYKNKF